MAYHIYLGGLEFPVAPSTITTKINNKNKTYELINLSDINRIQPAGLREFKFDLLIPAVDKYSFAEYPNGTFKHAIDYLVWLNMLKSETLVFPMVIARYGPTGYHFFDTRWDVTIEGYEVKEDYRQGYDHIVSLNLKEYKHYYTKTLTAEAPTAAVTPTGDNAAVGTIEETRPNKLTDWLNFGTGITGSEIVKKGPVDAPISKTPAAVTSTKYTVQPGDGLWQIAQTFWGNGDRWKEIYKANQALIDSTNAGTTLPYYTIHPGQELVIPGALEGVMVSLL